jgi:hypothetical protein
MKTKGYALVDENNNAFSWHPDFEDAKFRCEWELNVYGRRFRIVKDIEATCAARKTLLLERKKVC